MDKFNVKLLFESTGNEITTKVKEGATKKYARIVKNNCYSDILDANPIINEWGLQGLTLVKLYFSQ